MTISAYHICRHLGKRDSESGFFFVPLPLRPSLDLEMRQQTRSYIEEIPPELRLEIAYYLDPRDILSLSRVCHLLATGVPYLI